MAPTTTGEQHTLVALCNYQNIDLARQYLFSDDPVSLNSAFKESSRGRTWFTGDIFVVAFGLPGTCDPPAVSQMARDEMAKQGADLDAYTRHIYV